MTVFFAAAAPILARVAGSMGALVGPVPNSGVEGDMPSLLKIVDTSVPAGPMRECLHAGLWVLADDLNQAHRICQEIATPHGAAWHAIVHRREGDFWNSKYWWRRAAGVRFAGLSERIKATLKDATPEIAFWSGGERHDAARFVDLVERFAERPEMRDALVTAQRMEWAALFEECWSG